MSLPVACDHICCYSASAGMMWSHLLLQGICRHDVITPVATVHLPAWCDHICCYSASAGMVWSHLLLQCIYHMMWSHLLLQCICRHDAITSVATAHLPAWCDHICCYSASVGMVWSHLLLQCICCHDAITSVATVHLPSYAFLPASCCRPVDVFYMYRKCNNFYIVSELLQYALLHADFLLRYSSWHWSVM